MKSIIIITLCFLTLHIYAQTDSSIVNVSKLKPELEGNDQKKGDDNKLKADTSKKGGNEKVFNTIVLKAYNINRDNDFSVYGDEIIIEMDSLNKLNEFSGRVNKQIHLFINGIEMKGIVGKTTMIPDDKGGFKEVLLFILKRNELTNPAWKDLIGRNNFKLIGINTFKLSVGIEGEQEQRTVVTGFRFSTMRSSQFWIMITFIAGVFWLPLIILARRSSILCEPQITGEQKYKAPYSLALTQMAFWYVLIMSSTVFIYMINKEAPVLNKTALVLMGISTITGVVANSMNTNKKVEERNKLLQIQNEKEVLELRLNELELNLNSQNTLEYAEKLKKEILDGKDRLKELKLLISEAEIVNPIDRHKSFIKDILSDSNGVSLHRFQIVGWTVALGVVYIIMVLKNIVLPEFDDTLLALMGISSGAYLGFKIPEQKA
ncbi:MAG TPA: hypothetical protein PKD94_02055 [Ignavibacteria bacterium]|nr:hypothetical protein [Ignavibacteria bacterium]